MNEGYMSPDEVRAAAIHLQPLLNEVIKHSATLDPMSIKVYHPGKTFNRVQRLILRALRKKWGQRSVTEHAGYAFMGVQPSIHGVIFVEKGSIWIATQYQPALRRSTDLYVKHSVIDYVDVCLADSVIASYEIAKRNINDTRYAIERLLPDGHPMKSFQRPSESARAKSGSTVND